MKVSLNIKPKPSLPLFLRKISLFYILFHKTAHGIYPYIFVPKGIYDNLCSSKPDVYNISLIKHEQTHLDRQKEIGWLKWILKYLVIPEFRFTEEILADKASMKYLKQEKLEYPFEKRAKILSGWLYLKPVSYERALKELKSAWDEA